MTRRAFAVCAHPDDIEFLMAGTLLLLQEAGYEIHYMTVANGSCGSLDQDAATISRIRTGESRAAAELVGAIYHPPLVNDVEIFYDLPTLSRMGSVMRDVGPEILLTHAPADYMEDHVNAGRLAVTAAFCRGMPNFPADPPRETVGGSVTVYHAQPHGNRDIFGELVTPQMYVDVASVIDRKEAMLACHKSQKEWLDATQGMDSYLAAMRDLAAETGGMSGKFEYAEGWRKRLHLGFGDAGADPLAEALGQKVLRT